MKRYRIKIISIAILLLIAIFSFGMYHKYENSYSEFILYIPDSYGEFKPNPNFKKYDQQKLEKLFIEYSIEYKKENEIYLIKNKDLNVHDLMCTISDQYFLREKTSVIKEKLLNKNR